MLLDRIKETLDRVIKGKNGSGLASTEIHDPAIINSFVSDPQNTFLVSFPRTGSHWLRMVVELYFERPSLVRVFYYPERQDFLTLHTHDLELDVERENVIYLYRDPVDTIYSQLCYYKERLDDRGRIAYWADLYGRHLAKWLETETFTTKKTILTYERMKEDLVEEFRKVTDHFGVTLDPDRLTECAETVSKDEVKRKTPDDPQVVQLRNDYEAARAEFRANQAGLVCDVVTERRSALLNSSSGKTLDHVRTSCR